MKKILALVLALCMALSLGSFAMAEDVALRVWVGDNADMDWINDVIEGFKAVHPDTTYAIEVGIQTEGDCSRVVLTDPEAAADVFTFADDQFNSMYNAGVQVVEALLAITSNPGFKEADSDPFVADVKDGSPIVGISGTWNANAAAETWSGNCAAIKLPTFTVNGEQMQMSSFAGFKLVGVNAYSANVGDAMDFVAHMTNYDSQMSRFQLRSQSPSNVEAAASAEVQNNPAIAALAAQAGFTDVQRVGQKYWDPGAALCKIIVNGNPDAIELQTMLDQAVAGITAPADQ